MFDFHYLSVHSAATSVPSVPWKGWIPRLCSFSKSPLSTLVCDRKRKKINLGNAGYCWGETSLALPTKLSFVLVGTWFYWYPDSIVEMGVYYLIHGSRVSCLPVE
jgi:hypothetical protein